MLETQPCLKLLEIHFTRYLTFIDTHGYSEFCQTPKMDQEGALNKEEEEFRKT